jgi:hypothetical protein
MAGQLSGGFPGSAHSLARRICLDSPLPIAYASSRNLKGINEAPMARRHDIFVTIVEGPSPRIGSGSCRA